MIIARSIRMLCFVALLFSVENAVFSQSIVRVKVVSVQTLNNADCDADILFITNNSDFVWEFTATDNTLGYTNNNPALFGVFDFNYANFNGNNGPYTIATPNGGFSPSNGLFFDHQYICPSDVPTVVNLAWEAYENDDAGNYDILGLTDGETGIQNVAMPVPGAPGTLNYSFSASGSGGGCNQTYVINLQVERVDFATSVIILADDICDANLININTTYQTAICASNTLETNEPRGGDVATNNSSAWFKFVAPASGSVEVTTDLGGTEIGTYIEIYHAADGGNCGTGIQPITGVLIKDKFDYLSHIQFSDGIDLLGLDPEAQISLNACDPLPLISYQKLIAGETYYVQLTGDDPNDAGIVEVRVNDLGGGPAADAEDIPCLSSSVPYGLAPVSNQTGNPPSVTIDFGCAYDGGDDFAETGAAHTNNNPNNYHAYDYDHVAENNGTVNESVWFNFVAPNNGRMIIETDYDDVIYGENNALFAYDVRFSPGIPSDYSCANLEFMDADDGGANNFLGGDPSAVIAARCLEPGYKYFGMMDPSDALTPLSSQEISSWIYDPSVSDPSLNPPGNDILCLAFADPLYEIPVTPAGTNPNFQAVAGTNVLACREYLAGEPASADLSGDRADQTVWHYFVAPPSGAVEMNLRAYIGLDTLRYAIYTFLNGTDCYGGLQPATFTEDGTRNTPLITPMLQGSAGFEGTQESICCLTPGALYAVQLDGGSPGDEGQYIIEYIREVESDAGDIELELIAAAETITVTSGDTAFVCWGETVDPNIMLNGIGESTMSIPSCLTLGYVIHQTNPVPDPVSGSGFMFIDSLQSDNGVFLNDTDGSGTFGNPLFNQIYYVSPMADEPANWGDLTCNSSTVENGVPIVFLQPVVPVSNYNNALCEITFTANGGLATFYGSNFSYTIADGSMNLVETGVFSAGVNVVFAVPSADVFTISVNDGACPYVFTVDATACSNPCIVAPNLNFVNASICNGQSIFLEGANQTTAGLYTDVFIGANGCDSAVYTTLTVIEPSFFAQEFTICEGASISVGTNVYNTSGIYTDVFVATNGCDSTVTTALFVTSTLTSNTSATICEGDSYSFGSSTYNTSGTYLDNLISVDGCDSIATLFLTVLPVENGSFAMTICAGQTYSFDGNTLSASGTYQQTVTAANGCDSIVTLYLTVLPELTGSTSATICSGQTYSFNGQTLSSAGTYTANLTNANGCDSTVTLYLFVDDAVETFQEVTIGLGDTYIFGTQTLSVPGNYTEVFTTSAGCDSIVYLTLNVSDFLISNMVTPNDDGQNDTWKISNLSIISGCDVMIYNRWGQPVYSTSDYQNDWNGTKDGEPLPDGVYYYSIKCSDTEYTGEINLFRFKK